MIERGEDIRRLHTQYPQVSLLILKIMFKNKLPNVHNFKYDFQCANTQYAITTSIATSPYYNFPVQLTKPQCHHDFSIALLMCGHFFYDYSCDSTRRLSLQRRNSNLDSSRQTLGPVAGLSKQQVNGTNILWVEPP